MVTASANGQHPFSIATDFNLQRSFKKGTQYWAVGQILSAQLHFSSKDAGYAWLGYFSNGRFSNQVLATPKIPISSLPGLPYTSNTRMRFKHVSLGWKHYLLGDAMTERRPGAYTLAGLGILLGLVQNDHAEAIDTNSYYLPVLPGRQNFKRMTLDLGIGGEYYLGADLYIFGEAKAIIPMTDAPNRYLLDNKYTPYTGSLSVGFRILFNNEDL